ncbi:uncharacterized protein BDCG_07885 [Blastomyces dermatitidis ER-3]|uniref:Uncharacterized protein n=2 Tax=Blastomyces TaxID=229219 RepID=A0A179UJH0_BLAGS|nr:uncharacterized protein BDBG_04117 [Blastomyces gilchristii SLH14081]XP_045272542.1 uncharacterized protein BDCG_07885 [Blastomyces dermatitidis ER-3]EEQ84615.1 hypothetical protein BDCG_07885 [Blastomyces dermatitidis ER-3]EQL30166.1 hypothetical protein BDFG_07348 [Blastomyces dermatitidis ATCC 26199]OAT08134.1 hypothetical protein BDBG_04117 [Blastomyces gilchristii SLH14081]
MGRGAKKGTTLGKTLYSFSVANGQSGNAGGQYETETRGSNWREYSDEGFNKIMTGNSLSLRASDLSKTRPRWAANDEVAAFFLGRRDSTTKCSSHKPTFGGGMLEGVVEALPWAK